MIRIYCYHYTNCIVLPIIRWWLKGKIDYMERMYFGCNDDADIGRDGKGQDYYEGKQHGIDAALRIVLDKDVTRG